MNVLRSSSHRHTRALRLAALLGTIGTLLACATQAAAIYVPPAPVPCSSIGSGKYDCQFYPAGNGISGGAPVQSASGSRVGYLNEGTNWVTCESWGTKVGTSSTYNHWWAYTEANDGTWGWVNAYWATGGGNDGGFQGVPDCNGAHGYPPGGSASTADNNQEPCGAIGGGKYNCYFYPAGDGISAGAPVQAASGSRVGYLNHGINWVLCQSQGSEVGTTNTFNNWWAWTEANDGKWGWVNAYYAQGGSNNGSFQNVPGCGSAHGSAPIVAPPPKPKPTPPPPKPPTSAPAPVPCHASGGGQYTCTFYPAGDGFSGGAPVEASDRSLQGYLNQGDNWIICQQVGGEVASGSSHNDWWGYTEADDGRWGWVNALYGQGGANDGQFQGVPNCNGSKGGVPSGSATGSPPSSGGGGGSTPPSGGGAPDSIPPVYVPMYQLAGSYYGVNWLLIASIHAQETNFSRSTLPSVHSGYNCAGAAGPMQFGIGISSSLTSCGNAGDSWATWRNSYTTFASKRPASYPWRSGATVCLPGGGHPCVYDDFDAIMAGAHYLSALGADTGLGSASWTAAEHYNGGPNASGGEPAQYADDVIGRAKAWQAGQAGGSHFGSVVYEDRTIKVTSARVAVAAMATVASKHRHRVRHRQPKRLFIIHYKHSLHIAKRDFRHFIRAWHYARPGRLYVVQYTRVRHKHTRHHHKKRSHK